MPSIVSVADVSFGSQVYGDILIPSIQSSGSLLNDLGLYNLSGNIQIPTITTNGALSFSEGGPQNNFYVFSGGNWNLVTPIIL